MSTAWHAVAAAFHHATLLPIRVKHYNNLQHYNAHINYSQNKSALGFYKPVRDLGDRDPFR